jgi:signal transduction histidine kinase
MQDLGAPLGKAVGKVGLDSAVDAADRQPLQEFTATIDAERTRQTAGSDPCLLSESSAQEIERTSRDTPNREAIRHTERVVHDLKNLLMVVKGNLQLLKENLEDERLLRFTRNSMRAVGRATGLINQLLAPAREQRPRPQPINVNELISANEELISRALGPAIRVALVSAPNLWRAHVDPMQLEFALLNLAINARDAMPDGGTLTIETTNVDALPDAVEELAYRSYVGISVRDTGVGMSAEVLARAFDPFFTTKPPGKGSGVGLSQVYAVAQESGGTARIESEPGLGTTIRIFLPRAQGISLRTQNRSDHEIHPARGSVFSNTQATQINASRSNETL